MLREKSACQLLKYGANGTHFQTVSSGRWSKCCTNETDGCVTNRDRAWETNSNPSYFHAWPVSTWRGWECPILVRCSFPGSAGGEVWRCSTIQQVPQRKYTVAVSQTWEVCLMHYPIFLLICFLFFLGGVFFFFFAKWSDIFPKFTDFMILIGRMLFISTFKNMYKSMVWFGSGKNKNDSLSRKGWPWLKDTSPVCRICCKTQTVLSWSPNPTFYPDFLPTRFRGTSTATRRGPLASQRRRPSFAELQESPRSSNVDNFWVFPDNDVFGIQ